MPSLEEVSKAADLISKFYALLTEGNIPLELKMQLTRDYFNSWLQWEDDDSDDDKIEVIPNPLIPGEYVYAPFYSKAK